MKTMNKERKKKIISQDRKDLIFAICLAIIPLAQYFVFYICVNFNSFIMAFQKYEMNLSMQSGKYVFAGFDNFRKLYNEFINLGLIGSCIKNSLIFYGINTFIGTFLSLVFAYYIAKKRFMSKTFKVILFLPSIISSIVLITVFKYFVDYGIPSLLQNIIGGVVKGLISNKDTAFACILFYNIWAGFGMGILLYSGAMVNISTSVIEAADIDGAGAIKQFFRIVIPLIYPTLKTFLITGFTAIFISDMGLFSFFGTDAERYLWTFGYYLLRGARNAASLAEYPMLSALGMVLTAIAVPLTFTFRSLLNKYGPKTE